ncbi:MAG: DUF2735 domain-containing protein [Pseudolabrys sp.]|jgi:hypothetical protein|nr:DUF2735 domain-containing protein [Pseudolabrys sp.]
MTANHERASAQIFQFPVGGRAGLNSPRDLGKGVAVTPLLADIAVGDSWYHEQAIRDDKPKH